MASYINKFVLFITYPFCAGLPLFVSFFILSASVECVGFCLFETLPKAIYIAMHHFVVVYILILLDGLLKKKVQKIYRTIAWMALTVNLFIDLVCVHSFHFTFDQEVPAIILGTNSSEAVEFIQVFMPLKFWAVLISFSVLVLIVNHFFRNYTFKLKLLGSILGVTLVVLSFATTLFCDSQNWGNVSLTKVNSFIKASSPIALKDYQCHCELAVGKQRGPKYIVLIIGESLSKFHCSLYGYDKPTNPMLSQLEQDGSLLVFENARTSALNTIPVFKTIMSTYKLEYGDSMNWFECPTLPMIMREANYYTCWFSNQSQKGYHDNVIAQYASLCDSAIFNGNRFAAMGKCDLDGDLIHVVEDYMGNNDHPCQFHVIHLMGSHPDFKKRYPSEFQIFNTYDYVEALPSQRDNFAAYDNSVLYNDYVVSRLMNIYKDEESIIIYFSDHGMDVYDSRKDYVGHSRDNDLTSANVGYNIPYMIYMSQKLKKNFPCLSRELEDAINDKFSTDNTVSVVMDIAGVSFLTE